MSTTASRRRPAAASGPGSRSASRRRPPRGRSRRPVRRPYQRAVMRRRLIAIMVMVTVTAVVGTVWFTPVLGVREVEVRGAVHLTAAEVREAAAVEAGTPLVRVDVHAVDARVRELPRVAGVHVERLPPGTLRLTVDEREPVAVINSPDGAHLVDATAKDYATVTGPPPGLPELRVGPDALAAAVGVITQLPEALRREVLVVTADTPSDVRVTLSAGREARWGSSADTPRKAAVLEVLMTRKGTVFDVSSPELPTVS